jgi:hypothetical protein
MGIWKFLRLFRHDIPKVFKIKKNQGKLKYSH